MLFKLSRKSSNQVQASAPSASKGKPRADGLSEQQAVLVCKFQSIIEREIAHLSYDDQRAAYRSLEAALQWSRRHSAQTNLFTLRAAYNDAQASDLGMARR